MYYQIVRYMNGTGASSEGALPSMCFVDQQRWPGCNEAKVNKSKYCCHGGVFLQYWTIRWEENKWYKKFL